VIPTASVPSSSAAAGAEPLPLSALNDFLYCQRRAALKFIDGLRGANEHTVLGDLAHEHVDFPGYEQRAGWTLLRALPLFSDKLGLSGKADLVEVRFRESQISDLKSPIHDREVVQAARPVEYKKGPKRRFENDEVQLCAQALCLEEMFGLAIESGAIFHAQSQQRHEVFFEADLRERTLSAISDLRFLISNSAAPAAELKPQCEGCSLHEVCLPEAAGRRAGRLFEPRDY
jgi:CRISPR-associated exonuclease Cas4